MRNLYIDIMDNVVNAYTADYIRCYTDSVIENGLSEHGFPRLTANLGILIAHGKKTEFTEDFLKMMDLCINEIPSIYKKSETRAGNNFSVKEIVLCILELEKAQIFDKSITDSWRAGLAEIDPYSAYYRVASYPPQRINNLAAFSAASEQLRKYAGIGDKSFFIENQIESQLFSFDENGMYRDPGAPMVYDMVTRLQLAVALYFGFDGECAKQLEEHLEKSADLTLKMQSVTGEIPFGGRSNQFLHDETFYAALCEFYACFFKKRGDLKKAGMFKRAARLAVESVLPWLKENPVPHIKNYYPTDSMYGCEGYAYYDKYMVTTASWAYLAYVMSDDGIEEVSCPCENENYICMTSEHFHKVFLKCGDFFVEYDTEANERYDATGLGRVHKKGAPSTICMSVPYPMSGANYSVDIENPVPFAICGGIKVNNIFEYACEGGRYTLISQKNETGGVSARFEVSTKSGAVLEEECMVSADGVEITVKGCGDVAIQFPVFEFDGKNYTEKSISGGYANVSYCGYTCLYTTDGIIEDKNIELANRNGHCRVYTAIAKNSVTLKIHIDKCEGKS